MGCCCTRPVTDDIVQYSKIKGSLQTGDIILFQGTGWESTWVRWGTCSPISHIGIVVRCNQLDPYMGKEGNKENLYILHSNSDSPLNPDIISGELKSGCQLNQLDVTLRSYIGYVYVRRIYSGPFDTTERLCSDEFYEWLQDVVRKPYTEDFNELVLATWDGPGGENEEHTESYFCSKLIAEALYRLGYIDLDLSTSEYVPNDFASWSLKSVEGGMEIDKEKKLDFGKRVRKRY